MSTNGCKPLELGIPGAGEDLLLHGVPFRVVRRDGRVAPLAYGRRVDVGHTVGCLFFLGMTTQARSGECGWSGERFYGYERKLYLGDVLGRVHLLYEGNVMDTLPLIFGVNVWNYETFSAVRPHEEPVFPVFAPYREPFESDASARRLLDESLILLENESGEKYTKYGLAYEARPRRLEQLWLRPWGARSAGIGISAITVAEPEAEAFAPAATSAWRMTNDGFYVQRRYFPALDRLARRLYQYRDEIPAHFSPSAPEGYRGPSVRLTGAPEAELLANVYAHNIHDMATNKVEDSGRMHTSTRNSPCYGFYEGIGTFRKVGQYNYFEQMWSRDLGRLLCELIEHGERERCVRAADVMLQYLYDPSVTYTRPHWKRIINASELGVFPEDYRGMSFQEFVQGRENDGHASVMLMLYRLFHHGCVGVEYLRAHWQQLVDAAEWFCWQMESPGESAFNGVLCSESEASNGEYGGYDLFSNSYAEAALRAFARLAHAVGNDPLARRWQSCADRLWQGIERAFTAWHPRYGRVLAEPESDNWPSDLKRMASLLLLPELMGYDPAQDSPGRCELWANTYRAQKEQFFSPMVGGSMGYGQGYTTQTALLLDEVEDYTPCLEWAARFSYHHSEHPYIVPEGVTYHPSGRFWYRHTDLGNAVQQTEIVKCVRLVLGLDDLQPELGLRLVPRLADGWQGLEVQDYPVVGFCGGQQVRVPVTWRYRRQGDGYAATLTSGCPLRVHSVRIGPFPPDTDRVWVSGAPGAISLQQRGSRRYAYVPVERDVLELRLEARISSQAHTARAG